MLISYPVLGVTKVRESPYGGRYPIAVFEDSKHKGLTAGWHGGQHMQVNPTSEGSSVRAIADGIVVAYRVPTRWVEKDGKRMLLDSKDPSLKDHALNYLSWTDDGFVLLKHEKECGEGRPVVFYSLYMHLASVSIKTSRGKSPGSIQNNPQITNQDGAMSPLALKRKEVMGEAGYIEGQPSQIHFEIFTSDADLQKFFKVCDGRKDPWGELYFIIPAGQPVYPTKPVKGVKPQASQATPAELTIALRYQDGDIHFRSLDENGLELESWPRTKSEYELYGEAEKIDRGKLSRSYELLRFGRFMEWPELENDKKPSPAHCWHFLPMLKGWVDFADDAVQKRSDSDFMEWQWQSVSIGEAGFDPTNGLCQVSKLFSALDENGEGHLTDLEFKEWRKRDENKALLGKLVVQFQSEWDGSDPDKRWGWVKESWANPVKYETTALQNKIAWVKAQADQAKQSLPKLEKRVLQAKGWCSQIAAQKAEADAALAATQQSLDEASKAREAARSDPNVQRAALKALDAALTAKKQAEQAVKETAPLLARAEAWVAREEAKHQTAQDSIALADPLIQELKNNLAYAAQKPAAPNAAAHAETDFAAYKTYMKALQFWEQVPGLPDSKVWHFHPLAFIEFFKRCHWLSQDDLVDVYGWHDPQKTDSPAAATRRKKRETYRVALNRVMWKYGITSPTRMAHFLGQGGHECNTLLTMEEGEDGTQYEGRHGLGNVQTGDGPRFKGKGMKQLTGCFNYVQYWVYRGWLDKVWLGRVWYKTAVKKNGITTWVQPKDPPPTLDDPKPEILSKDPFNAIDTGGWFWEAGGRYPINGERDEVTGGWSFKSGTKTPINRVFIENQVDDRTIDMVSDAINPGEEAVKDKNGNIVNRKKLEFRIGRREKTWQVWNALHDFPDPFPVKVSTVAKVQESEQTTSVPKPGADAKSETKAIQKPTQAAGKALPKSMPPPANTKKSLLTRLLGSLR